MSNSPNVMGMVNDADFQSLAPADKRSALSKLTGDKSFSALSDAETMQFVSKLSQPKIPGAPNGLPQQPKNSVGAVTPPLPQGLQGPNTFKPPETGGAFPTMGQYGVAEKTPYAAPALGVGVNAGLAAANPIATARGMVGALAGSSVGGYGGGEIGSLFGERETGRKIGAGIGGVAGTVMAARGGIPTRYGFLKAMFSDPEVSEAAKVEAAKKALAETPEMAENPQDLISRMKKLVIPGEQPTAADLKRAGDLTQTPLTKLQALAKFGDRLAQNELNRRLKQ